MRKRLRTLGFVLTIIGLGFVIGGGVAFAKAQDGYQSLKGKASHLGENVGAAKENLTHAMHDASDRLSRNSQVLGQQSAQDRSEHPRLGHPCLVDHKDAATRQLYG